MDIVHTKKYDHLFKLLIIGDSGVGKSSILNRFSDDTFSSTFISTIGIDFKAKIIKINDKIIKLQIWDTAGQERFRSITTAYYRGAMGVFLVYDVTNQKSFDNIKMWLQNIQSRNTEIMLITLIGNKSDLENKRVVTTDVGKIFAKENNLDFYETSAKNNDNIDQIFINASKKILSNITKSIKTPQHIIENVIVKESEHQQRDKCCYFF